MLRVGAALLLTSPFTPMLFMGEEWGARTPWQFFSDHEGELGEAVRRGRRAEFASHGWAAVDVPDPQSPQTARDSTLDWSEPQSQRGAALMAWYRELIALRRSRPELSDGRRDAVDVSWDSDARWLVVRRGAIAVACNLSPDRQSVPLPGVLGAVLVASTDDVAGGSDRVDTAGESVVVVALA
jgi:maltooligosyltrehalose trehalohydrolase